MKISQTPRSICFRKSATKTSSVKWLTSSYWQLCCSWLETLLWLVSSKAYIPIWRWCLSPWEHSHFSPTVTDSPEFSIVSILGRSGAFVLMESNPIPLFWTHLFPLKPPGEAGIVSPKVRNLTDALGYCDLIRTIHLVFVPGSWHRIPKSLVIS